MQQVDLNILLNSTEKVAKSAARNLFKNLDKYRDIRLNFTRDVKIEADHMLHSYIIEKLAQISDYPIVSEENPFNPKFDRGFCWILDPLDGSLNFSRGIPICCISISLWKDMKPLLGVVYDFNRYETFSGLVGKGAWLNGKPIRVSKISGKAKAILCTGFPVSTNFSSKSLAKFVEEIRSHQKVRLLGSAAVSLAYVSCGRADFYMENDIKIWDVAAGLCLVKAAGGEIRYQRSTCEYVFNVRAGNHFFFKQ
ncbi:MAG: inositol monophosphatase family protein [Nanoarchaeota archaeon]